MQVDGSLIRQLRERHGYGLRRFAAAIDLSPSYLSRIERGQRNPAPEVATRIVRELGSNIADIEQPRVE
ncbi:helix-turn-helix domain-containing protein [Streptomyces carpaticus]|uniref:helix-turn-helix domain-containing protein n=1 Tax=Streptomyces carpaticus TaxID=285558 RepID=UPI00337FA23C